MQIPLPNLCTMGKTTLKNPTHSILFSFVLFLSLPTSTPLHYQPFLPLPLPLQNPQTTLAHKTFTPSITKLPSPTNQITELPSSTTLSLDLHHRDSLSNAAPETLLSLRLARDAARANSIIDFVDLAVRTNATRAKKKWDIGSSVVSRGATGEYYIRLGVGTPPRYGYVSMDTGSDVFWIQCMPCKKCHSQSDPVFDPKKSSTYASVGCGSPLCQRLDSPGCDRGTKNCQYGVSYGDGSTTFGDLSTETLTFRKTRVKNVAMGCGHDNEGLFRGGAAGLLGLGKGKLSFPVQTGRQFGKKFSYCFVDFPISSKTSSLIFGDSAVSQKARFTPLLKNPDPMLNTFYYLGLTGISVGGQKLKGISPTLFKLDNAGNGGVIIDSGLTVTKLTRPAYLALRNAFRARASHLKWASNFSIFDTCFDIPVKKEVDMPTVTLHFMGVDMELSRSNILFSVDNKTKFCFAFEGTTSRMSIIGNIQQQGFRIVYDLAGNRVGFAPNGCA